jgi:hypothetical protein
LNNTEDFFCGRYILEEEEEMKTHFIIGEHGTLMKYEKNIF